MRVLLCFLTCSLKCSLCCTLLCSLFCSPLCSLFCSLSVLSFVESRQSRMSYWFVGGISSSHLQACLAHTKKMQQSITILDSKKIPRLKADQRSPSTIFPCERHKRRFLQLYQNKSKLLMKYISQCLRLFHTSLLSRDSKSNLPVKTQVAVWLENAESTAVALVSRISLVSLVSWKLVSRISRVSWKDVRPEDAGGFSSAQDSTLLPRPDKKVKTKTRPQ